jgi:CheY-like chemotaxis protein
MDGVEATKAIRNGDAGEKARDVVIIAVTAYAMVEDRDKFVAEGMDDYIAKPVDLEQLEAVLARRLAPVSSGGPAEGASHPVQ